MTNDAALDEWAFLRSALQAHVEALSESGVDALAPCDEATLEQRRARYRELAALEPPPQPVESRAAPAAVRERTPPPAEHVLNPGGDHPVASIDVGRLADTSPAQLEDTSPAQLEDSRARTEAATPFPTERSMLSSEARPGLRSARSLATVSEVPGSEASVSANNLEELRTLVARCERCALHRTRTQTVFARGSGKSGLCFVGEGPGADEDAQGYPFVGAAGQLLDKMIAAMGFARDEVYVCNIVKCRPPNNRKPERQEMQACSGFLTRQLELIAPRVIVALGATAVEGLLGLTGIMRLRGQWRLYKGEIPVMPTFHPAYLLRQPEAKRDVWNDLKLVREHLGNASLVP